MTSPLDQKIKITGPVIVTANRVTDGAVMYRGRDEAWTTRFDEAAVATSVPAARGLLAVAQSDDNYAVGAYIAPVDLAPDGRARPGNLRELIRAAGPTVEARIAA